MSDKSTKTMMAAYFQEPGITSFMSGFFTLRRENLYDTEQIEIDLQRSDEDIAIVVTDPSTGFRMNSEDLYTNKSFKPPVYKEGIGLNSHQLTQRNPGDEPFKSPKFRANLISRLFSGMKKVEAKIRRSIELQASQVLQTGTVTLKNESGVDLYTLSYSPKATHFPTSGVSWATATTAQKLADLQSLCEVIVKDGKQKVDQLIFGIDAYNALIADTGIQALLDLRRANVGTIVPMQPRGDGGIYRGTLEIGNNKLDLWTYDGYYKDPQTGLMTEFMDRAKIVARSSKGRMDASFGNIPHIGSLLGVGRNLVPELPTRMSSRSAGMDLHPRVWLSQDGEQLSGGVSARPLMIPVAIDTFGCLDTGL